MTLLGLSSDGSVPTSGVLVQGKDGSGNAQDLKVDTDGELQVDVLTMPTVAVTQSGTWDEVGINDSGNLISVDDGAGSLTVDGTVAVSGTVAVTQSGAWDEVGINDSGNSITVDGTITSTNETVATATLSNVASSATSVQLLGSTAGRKGGYFFNDSTQVLYIKFGTTASATSFTVKMAAGSFYEIPQPVYTGRIDGIWASADGNVRITELT